MNLAAREFDKGRCAFFMAAMGRLLTQTVPDSSRS
jgi:hypothetical protein